MCMCMYAYVYMQVIVYVQVCGLFSIPADPGLKTSVKEARGRLVLTRAEMLAFGVVEKLAKGEFTHSQAEVKMRGVKRTIPDARAGVTWKQCHAAIRSAAANVLTGKNPS